MYLIADMIVTEFVSHLIKHLQIRVQFVNCSIKYCNFHPLQRKESILIRWFLKRIVEKIRET